MANKAGKNVRTGSQADRPSAVPRTAHPAALTAISLQALALALSEMGIGVLSSIIPLLRARKERTRQHAQGVLERITFKEISRSISSPPSSIRAKSTWKTLWQKNGSYRWDAPHEQRQKAIKCWEQWLAETH